MESGRSVLATKSGGGNPNKTIKFTKMILYILLQTFKDLKYTFVFFFITISVPLWMHNGDLMLF